MASTFFVFVCLAFFEGLFITIIINWPSLLRTSKSSIQEALYVSSSDASAVFLFRPPSQPSNLLLFVAVLTHAARKARRDALRETWFSECKTRRREAFCGFFTDRAGLDNDTNMAVTRENEEHDDLVFLSLEDNFAFAERLLQAMEWAMERYKFDYFLRIDDDHFLCLGRLLYELNFRPKHALYWGFVHCKAKIVRVDEAWLILTRDLIEEILEKRNTSLLCSPYGDQAVALWMSNSSKNVSYFMDNQRIIHKSAGKDQNFFTSNICTSYLSLHGSYPRAMRQFWLVSHVFHESAAGSVLYNIPEIEPFEKLCPHSRKFDHRGFIREYRFEPKPCSENPNWRVSSQKHLGREETGERYSNYN